MDKPYDVPEDIWVASVEAAKKWFGSEWDENDLTCDNFVGVMVEIGIKERERCLLIAGREIENTDILVSRPPKSSAAWKIRDAILSGS